MIVRSGRGTEKVKAAETGSGVKFLRLTAVKSYRARLFKTKNPGNEVKPVPEA